MPFVTPSREETWHLIVSTAVHTQGWALVDAKVGGVSLPAWPGVDEPAPAGLGAGDAVALRPARATETGDTEVIFLRVSGVDTEIGIASSPPSPTGPDPSWDTGTSTVAAGAVSVVSTIPAPLPGYGELVWLDARGLYYVQVDGPLTLSAPVYVGLCLPVSVPERTDSVSLPAVLEMRGVGAMTLIDHTGTFGSVTFPSTAIVRTFGPGREPTIVADPARVQATVGLDDVWAAEIAGVRYLHSSDLTTTLGVLIDNETGEEYVFVNAGSDINLALQVDPSAGSCSRFLHHLGYAGGAVV